MKQHTDFDFWLVLSAKEAPYNDDLIGATPRVMAKKPSLKDNEIAVKMTLKVPSVFFSKPSLTFELSIPEPNQEIHIDVAQQTAIAEALHEQLGIRVELRASSDD